MCSAVRLWEEIISGGTWGFYPYTPSYILHPSFPVTLEIHKPSLSFTSNQAFCWPLTPFTNYSALPPNTFSCHQDIHSPGTQWLYARDSIAHCALYSHKPGIGQNPGETCHMFCLLQIPLLSMLSGPYPLCSLFRCLISIIPSPCALCLLSSITQACTVPPPNTPLVNSYPGYF